MVKLGCLPPSFMINLLLILLHLSHSQDMVLENQSFLFLVHCMYCFYFLQFYFLLFWVFRTAVISVLGLFLVFGFSLGYNVGASIDTPYDPFLYPLSF